MDDERNLHEVDARVRAALMTDAAASDRVTARAGEARTASATAIKKTRQASGDMRFFSVP